MDALLPEIEMFCRTHQMAESRFGRDAVNDARLICQLRAGRELRRATADRIRRFMVTYRADSLAREAA